MGVLNLQQVPAGTGASRQGESLGFLAQLLQPIIKKKLDEDQADKAYQGLQSAYNAPRETEVQVPNTALETATAQSNIAQQKQFQSTPNEVSTTSPLEDLVRPSVVDSATPRSLGELVGGQSIQPTDIPKPDVVGQMALDSAKNPELPTPLQSKTTDVMPMTSQKVMRSPKQGDFDYRAFPQGQTAETYGRMARPTLEDMLVSNVNAQGNTQEAQQKAYETKLTGKGDQIVQTGDGKYVVVNKMHPNMPPRDTGVQGKTTDVIKQEVTGHDSNGLPITTNVAYRKVGPGWVKVQELGDTVNNVQARSAIAKEQARYNMVPVTDTNNNIMGYASKLKLSESPFGDYAATGEYAKAAGKRSFTEDIHANLIGTRTMLAKVPDFSAQSAAQIIEYMGNPANPKDVSTLHQLVQRATGETLSDAQLQYIRRLFPLTENAMSLRTLQGLGQGAQDQRRMISSLIPSGTTVSKRDANEQLNMLESTVNSVERGLLKARLNPPALITDENGFTPAAEVNKQWQGAIDAMRAKGFKYNPNTREWEQGTPTSTGISVSTPGASGGSVPIYAKNKAGARIQSFDGGKTWQAR